MFRHLFILHQWRLLVALSALGLGCAGCCSPANRKVKPDERTAQATASKDGTAYRFTKAEVAGHVFRKERKSELKHGKISLDGRDGFADLSEEFLGEFEDLEVKDGIVVKYRSKTLRSNMVLRIQIAGEVRTMSESDPFEGETIETEMIGNQWHRRLVGKTPTPAQQFFLRPAPIAKSDKSGFWFPLEAIPVGHRWDIEATLVMGFPLDFEKVEGGKWQRHFRKIVEIAGDSCAEISDDVDIFGAREIPEGTKRMSFKGTITEWRSLKTGQATKEVLEGTCTITISGPNQLPASISGHKREQTNFTPKSK